MLLKSVSLENIRSYKSATINFESGITLLLGDVGAGKSTILLAIEFALFGIVKGDQSGILLLRHGEREGSVTLSFTVNNHEVIIKRALKRSKKGIAQEPGLLTIDGISEQYTPMELKARILELLGYPSEFITKSAALLYRYTIYCPQEEMAAILDESSEDRLTTLRVIFAIDKYKRIAENATILVRELKQDKAILHARTEHLDEEEGKQRNLQETLTSLHDQLTVLSAERATLEENINLMTRELTDMEALSKERQRLLQEILLVEARLQDKQNRLASINEETDSLTARRAQLSHQITDLPPAEEIRNILENAEQAYRTALVSRKSWQEKVQEARILLDKYPALKDESMKLETQQMERAAQLQQKREFDKRRLALEQDLARSQAEMAVHEQAHAEYVQKLQRIGSLTTCPTCEQDVSEQHKENIAHQTEMALQEQHVVIGVLRKQRDQQRVTLNTIKQQLVLIEEQERAFFQTATALASMKGELSRLDILKAEQERLLAQQPLDLAAQGQELRTLREQYDRALLQDQLRQRLAEIDERGTFLKKNSAELIKEVNLLLAQQHTLQESIAVTPVVELEHQKQQLEELKSQELNLLTQHTATEREMHLLEEQHTVLQESIAIMRQERLKLERVQRMQHWIEAFFVPAVTTIEKQIMYSLHRQCDELFKYWCSALLSENLLTARLDDSFSPIIEQNGYESTVAHMSGGERTSIALAYRLALNHVVTSFHGSMQTTDLLILDEPTDGFSPQQLDRMQDVLKNVQASQVIIVSHEQKMENFVNTVLSVEKDQHESRISDAVHG